MTNKLEFTILGCGSSGGVPRLGGLWGQCDPLNPKNARTRCSLLVERTTEGEKTTVLIDTSPDLRQQLLSAKVGRLDGVVYTHAHADHVHGIDDLRMIVINMKERLEIWASKETQDALINRFGYAFAQPKGSPYPPILDANTINGPIVIDGPGGKIQIDPFEVDHGSIHTLGLKIDGVVYTPDIKEMTPASWAAANDCDVWVLDSLRRDPHPSHIHLQGALDWIDAAKPARAILTNLHIDLDYSTLQKETPGNVEPAFDGLKFRSGS